TSHISRFVILLESHVWWFSFHRAQPRLYPAEVHPHSDDHAKNGKYFARNGANMLGHPAREFPHHAPIQRFCLAAPQILCEMIGKIDFPVIIILSSANVE